MTEENKLIAPESGPQPMIGEAATAVQFKKMRVCRNFRQGTLLPSCGASGANELADALLAQVKEAGDFIDVELVHCLGRCHMGPTVKLTPAGPFLQEVKAEDVPRLIKMLKTGDVAAMEAAFPTRDPND